MVLVEVSRVSRSYVDKVAVDDLSFSVARGEVRVLSAPPSESTKNRIGYLPEERGLYRRLRVVDCITYLASLKGMDRHSAEKRAVSLLDQMGLLASKTAKVEALSHGMAQLVQFIVTIVHDPDLVVLDEPFAALDPVNAELLKGTIADLGKQGKAVILSTHRVNEVEELCERR